MRSLYRIIVWQLRNKNKRCQSNSLQSTIVSLHSKHSTAHHANRQMFLVVRSTTMIRPMFITKWDNLNKKHTSLSCKLCINSYNQGICRVYINKRYSFFANSTTKKNKNSRKDKHSCKESLVGTKDNQVKIRNSFYNCQMLPFLLTIFRLSTPNSRMIVVCRILQF